MEDFTKIKLPYLGTLIFDEAFGYQFKRLRPEIESAMYSFLVDSKVELDGTPQVPGSIRSNHPPYERPGVCTAELGLIDE